VGIDLAGHRLTLLRRHGLLLQLPKLRDNILVVAQVCP
jgi:hypothetical protein